MKTKSLWYVGPRELDIREISLDDPDPRQILVRISVCGVCAWDLRIYSGGYRNSRSYPFYFGHEGIGRVEKVGTEVTRVAVGDRVALRESAAIGAIGGGHMAEYALQSENEVIPLPEDNRPDEHWLIEPVACCVNTIDLAGISPGRRVALVGCGFMGSIILQLLALSPVASVDVFDMRRESLESARSIAGGAPVDVHDLGTAPDLSDLHSLFDTVIETAGSEKAFMLANSLVRKGGTLAIFSRQSRPFVFDFADWHSRGITVMNTSPASSKDFSDCFHRSVPLMRTGRIDLSSLVTHVAEPERAQEVFEDGLSKANGYIKGAIRWR